MTEYKTIAGTEPSETEAHEARTIVRTNSDETVYMMTEIGDGVFVQWGNCATCAKRVNSCTCKSGPKEPDYMEGWRTRRFADSFKSRGIGTDDDFTATSDTRPKRDVPTVKADKTAEKVDDGMDSALEAVRRAKEDTSDAGF